MMKKQTIERMVSTVAAVMVMAGLFAPAAMAEEVVRDHRDTSEEAQVVCIKAPCPGSSDSSAEEEEPYKDPGIRQCDITPVECEDTDESRDSVVVRDHRDGGGSKDEEAASAPGGVKVGVNNPSATAPKEAVSAPADEAEQAANSGTLTHDVCFYDDYYYDEETEMCWPNGGPFGVLTGDKPWPDSAGGYVGLLGDFVEDPLTGVGLGLQQGLGYVGDTLVEFGEGGGPIGWAIQGAGYAIGFFGDAGGELTVHVSEAVGAVADGVGEAVDAIGDAAGSVYDEVASWF